MKKKLAKRFNKGKLRWRNFPLFLLKPLIEVAQFGETKYDTYNFMSGFPVDSILDSLKRHLEQSENPFESDIDKESSCHHLAHVAWNALVALYVIEYMPELDDRYKKGIENERKRTASSKNRNNKHNTKIRRRIRKSKTSRS